MLRYKKLFILLGFWLLIGCVAAVTPEPTRKSHESMQTTQAPYIPTVDLPSLVADKLVGDEDKMTLDQPREIGGDADVEFVRAVQSSDGSWTFHVTVSHLDTGWEDYADGWDVVDPDGLVYKVKTSDPFTRVLLHPHENEQPFTRSQSAITIPDSTNSVTVRAHDLTDGFGGHQITVNLLTESGPEYEVSRP